jgi:O-antigen/teichoic acid export membrane protein
MVWMSVGYGLRLAIQALYFTVIARCLGASNYGAFIGVAALVGVAAPFGPLGTGNLLVQEVSRDRGLFAGVWGAAIATTAVTSSALIALVLLLSHFILPPTILFRLVAVVAIADIAAMNFITISGQAFQAFEQLKWTAAINFLSTAGRLAGALVLVGFNRHPSAMQWGYLYCGSTVVIAATAFCLVTAKLAAPRVPRRRTWTDIREGLYFSVSVSAESIYSDIDKTMLARLSTLEAAGLYGAAYRIVDVTFVPVLSLLSAAYPGFFRHGKGGILASMHYGRGLLKRILPYSLFASVAIWVGAPVVPWVLGNEYAHATEALRWLAALPLLKTFRSFAADTLTGAGHQGLRTLIQLGVAAVNILVNLWVIPAYGWRGAAWASVGSSALLWVALWGAANHLAGRAHSLIQQAAVPAAEAV